MATSHTRAGSRDDSPDPREQQDDSHRQPQDRPKTAPLFPHTEPRQSPPHSISHILSNTDDDEARRMSAAYTLTAARGPTHSPPMPTLIDHSDSPSPSSKRRRLSLSPEQDSASGRQESPYDDQSSKSKPKFTGHRRDITSASLTPLEAPTRHRNYLANSATRRKDAPLPPHTLNPSQYPPHHSYPQYLPAPPNTYYVSPPNDAGRKRLRPPSTSADDESEEDQHAPDAGAGPSIHQQQHTITRAGNPGSGSGGSAVDPLEIKRRQNTVAARRSRQRKLDHVRSLEEQVKSLTSERDDLRVTVGKLEYKIEVYREVIARGNGNPPMVD